MSHVKGQWNVICSTCEQGKSVDQFYLHSNGRPRKQCKTCVLGRRSVVAKEARNRIAAKYRETHREIQRLRCEKWRRNNLAYDAYRAATYRAAKAQRTPSWADQEKIKTIYMNCPPGFHVDHIIPLRGNAVSGLHTENNLQYLMAIDNIKKRNFYVL